MVAIQNPLSARLEKWKNITSNPEVLLPQFIGNPLDQWQGGHNVTKVKEKTSIFPLH
jgi:hypothetical protein